jgi:hypothetical protein
VARKRTGRRRGRPVNPHARRRAITRAGRRGVEVIDRGSEALRHHKRRVTGREDLPLDGAAVLFGHAHLDRQQFDALGLITQWLQRVARAWGGKDGSCAGLWMALLGASTATGNPVIPVPHGADNARRQLTRALRRLDGSRDLVVALAEGRTPPLVLRAVERCLTREDEDDLGRLRAGLDRIGGRFA